MDAIDRRILKELQQDGRLKIGDLAERVGLSPTPCARRVARLEADGVITGYGARVNPKALGLGVTVFVTIELDNQSNELVESFAREVARFEEVLECFLMTGSQDILMRVICEDLEAFDVFLQTRLMGLPNIRHFRSSFTLRNLASRPDLPTRSVR